MSTRPSKLEPSLALLPATHRRAVAEAIGAAGEQPAAIAATLLDESRLEALVRGLPSEARGAVTELAFAAVPLWTPSGAPRASHATLELLERHGLALCFKTWSSLTYAAPADLIAPLRRLRMRAHAGRIPDAPDPVRTMVTSEQLLHDVAAVGAAIAHGAVQVKADGELFAKARPKLAAALTEAVEPRLDFGEQRLERALIALRQLGALRVATDDLPGRNTRRELRLACDLPALLDRPFEERARLADVLQHEARDLLLIDPLLDELAGRRVPLDALGAAVVTLFSEAHKYLAVDSSGTPGGIGLYAVHLRWLSGRAVLGVNAEDRIATVSLVAQPPPEPDREPCIAQADFELVAMRPLLPHERAALLMLAEPVPGREHVARLTRERIQSAARVLDERDAEPILERLRALTGSLPQNVEQSIGDWIRQVRPRARLRSAIVLDLGDAERGDRVASALGELLAERLAPHLLAVPADELTAVVKVVRSAGIELEPGLDRVSGAWHEQAASADGPGSSSWRPSSALSEHDTPPPGVLVSGIDRSAPPTSPAAARAQDVLDGLELSLDMGGVPQFDDEFDDLEPEDVLTDAYELGEIVELSYAAAGGALVERVTVEELDGARLLVEDPDTGARHWRWLKGVRSARFVSS